MSKQASKFIEKAKSKLCSGLGLKQCIKPNDTLIYQEFSYSLVPTPVKYLDSKPNQTRKTKLKLLSTLNSEEETDLSINQLPLLVTTPETRRSTIFTSTFIHEQSETVKSLTISGINISIEDEPCSAFVNQLYDSPVLGNTTLTCNSFGIKSSEFDSVSSDLFTNFESCNSKTEDYFFENNVKYSRKLFY